MDEINNDQFENELQSLLAVYRCNVPPPHFTRVRIVQRAPQYAWLAAAAMIAIVAGAAWLFVPRANDWRASGSLRPLRAGAIVRAESSVRLTSRAVGVVDLAPGTTIRVIADRRRNRIALDEGSIHATTFSPPGIFMVDTPLAKAIDLGCEYTLNIAHDGSGELHVIAGWVDLWERGQQSLVPQGAISYVAADGRLSAPIFVDAPPRFQRAVRNYDREHDVATIAALARSRDALTLLNLFSRATPDERLVLFDRLNALVPAPPSIARESVRYWSPDTTEAWWPLALKAANLGPIKKSKDMLRGL
jgi:hypothetical protein